MTYDVVTQIAALNSMDGTDLRGLWKKLFDQETTVNQKPYLISRLAYRIQELAYGGISQDAQESLDALVKGEIKVGKSSKRLCAPPVGTKFVREYHDVEHHVMVIRSGFEYKGRTYKSLSEIAREITGTRWSGPLFFGLKNPKKNKTKD